MASNYLTEAILHHLTGRYYALQTISNCFYMIWVGFKPLDDFLCMPLGSMFNFSILRNAQSGTADIFSVRPLFSFLKDVAGSVCTQIRALQISAVAPQLLPVLYEVLSVHLHDVSPTSYSITPRDGARWMINYSSINNADYSKQTILRKRKRHTAMLCERYWRPGETFGEGATCLYHMEVFLKRYKWALLTNKTVTVRRTRCCTSNEKVTT